jgi:hypothetical protein
MLHINRGIQNTIYLTLRDKKHIAAGSAFYIFIKFVNDMTKEATYLMAVSPVAIAHQPRYSRIVFTEGTHVTLNPEGFFTYTVYEVTDNTLTDDSTLTSNDIIEQGKAFVKDGAVTEVSYTQYTPTDNVNTTNSNTVYLNI